MTGKRRAEGGKSRVDGWVVGGWCVVGGMVRGGDPGFLEAGSRSCFEAPFLFAAKKGNK